MAEMIERAGAPGYIRPDNGPEFIAHSLGRWLAGSENNFIWVTSQLGVNASTLWRWRKAGHV